MLSGEVKEAIILIRRLCIPFTFPEDYVLEDWHSRVSILTRTNDYLTLKISETPAFAHFIEESSNLREPIETEEARKRIALVDNRFELVTPSREIYSINIDKYMGLIDYKNVLKDQTDVENVIKILGDVPSVEKLAISACSLAICRYQLPVSIIMELCNIIRDECLHLLALTRLLGQDHLYQGWITPKRTPAWGQLRKCKSSSEHILLEHCLFEGEGSIAAYYAVYQSQQFNFPASAISVLSRIALEELRHTTTGYYLAHLLSTTDPQRINDSERAIELIREIEPLKPVETIKGRKQRIAEALAREWASTGDWLGVVRKIAFISEKFSEGLINTEIPKH